MKIKNRKYNENLNEPDFIFEINYEIYKYLSPNDKYNYFYVIKNNYFYK